MMTIIPRTDNAAITLQSSKRIHITWKALQDYTDFQPLLLGCAYHNKHTAGLRVLGFLISVTAVGESGPSPGTHH